MWASRWPAIRPSDESNMLSVRFTRYPISVCAKLRVLTVRDFRDVSISCAREDGEVLTVSGARSVDVHREDPSRPLWVSVEDCFKPGTGSLEWLSPSQEEVV